MVGRGAARLASDQAWIFDNCRCSSCANAVSKNLAWRCHAGSLVNGANGDSAEGIMPARNFAVSSAVALSAARTGVIATKNMAANSTAAASVAILNETNIFIRDPRTRRRRLDLPA